jgi:hypothetical protein
MLYIIFTDLILSQHQIHWSKTMLTFTFDELVQIERTLEKVYNSVAPLLNGQNAQELSFAKYIVAEARHCAQTLEMPDELTRPNSLKAKAVDRLVSMMHTAK